MPTASRTVTFYFLNTFSKILVLFLAVTSKVLHFDRLTMDNQTIFPAECLEQIFCHLTGRDLLKCSLVCPNWYEFIGTTRSCMEKIVIVCESKNDQRTIKRIFACSKRKYKGLSLFGKFTESVRNFLTIRQWTHIIINSLRFEASYWHNYNDGDHFMDLLRFLQPSIENLQLNFGEEFYFVGRGISKRYQDVDSLRDLQFP